MNAFFKILAIITGLLIPGLHPMTASGEEALKFRHITSIYADDQGLGLNHPEGVACNQNALLIVADTGNARLLKYTYKDKTVAPGVRVIKMPQLIYPVQVKLNSRDEMLVLDRKQRRIVRITAAGKFGGYIDGQGASSSAASAPKSFHIDKNDNLYILDVYAGQVIVTDPGGKYLKHFRIPQEYGFFTDLTVDFKGNIFLIDSVNARVFSASKNSDAFAPLTQSLKEYMRYPAAITTDKWGRIYLVDRNGSRIIILGQDGSYLGRLSAMGWKEGLLNYPSQICLNDSGEIFVADTNNNRVQIFSIIE
jgi:DNA-binding beta-propeller fold protein YncE